MKNLVNFIVSALVIVGFTSCKKEEYVKSKECDILEFRDRTIVDNTTVEWTINGLEITSVYPIDWPMMKFRPDIVTSFLATVSPNYSEQDFSNGKTVTYTVTAEDGITTKVYTAKATQMSSGTFGSVSWNIKDSTLTISGTGAMPDGRPLSRYQGHVTALFIENGITYISGFEDFNKLRTVIIPKSVENTSHQVFRFCAALTSIHVDVNNTKYSSENGVLFNKEKTVLIQYPRGKTDTKYSIPESVTSISQHAFYYFRNLTSITIPKSITSFYGATFVECLALTEIINHATTPQTGTYIFEGMDLSSCTLRVPAGSVNSYRSAPVWKDFGNIVAI